jgi:predicted transposase
MLCTLKMKLVPTPEQFHALLETMKRFNQACNYISKIAFRSRTFSKTKIQRLCYYDVREKFGLSAQMTIRAIGKVSESYRSDKKPCIPLKKPVRSCMIKESCPLKV